MSRIASMGAILYLVMDMIIHWGVFKHLREKIEANSVIVLTALLLDAVILTAFVWVKISSDLFVVGVSFVFILLIFIGERFFLKRTA
ncbi:hypothetical protein [Planococcus versutus]|uniref:hypothetical protein n=1 Tax=Planococcus versutus TaxID=1302659 RepID=UPI00138FDA92|nr:hypothetical protein [Planococcus versutus]